MATVYNVSHIPSPPPEFVPRRWLPNWLSSRIPNPILWFSNRNHPSNRVANDELVESSERLRRLIKNPTHLTHNPSTAFANALDAAFHLEPETDSESESEPNSKLGPKTTAATVNLGRTDVPYGGLRDIRITRKPSYMQGAVGRWLAENRRLDEIASRRYNLWENGTRWQCLEPNCDWSTEVDIDDFTGKEIEPEVCRRDGCGSKRFERIEGVSIPFACLSSYHFPILSLGLV